jgi:hypothetical protein
LGQCKDLALCAALLVCWDQCDFCSFACTSLVRSLIRSITHSLVLVTDRLQAPISQLDLVLMSYEQLRRDLGTRNCPLTNYGFWCVRQPLTKRAACVRLTERGWGVCGMPVSGRHRMVVQYTWDGPSQGLSRDSRGVKAEQG